MAGYEFRSRTLLSAFEYAFDLDMDALAGIRPMPLARGDQRPRLFGAFGLDEPFLEPRHQHRRMENSSPVLTRRLWLRYELVGRGWHPMVPGGESIVRKYFTVKSPPGTNQKHRS